MKGYIIFFSVILLSAVIANFTSCKKHEHSAPVITVNSPQPSDSIAVSDTVNVSITATDDESLHEMSVIIKSHAGDTVFTAYPYVHDLKTYMFNDYYHTNNAGMYHLHVSAVDHDNKRSNKEVLFYLVQ